MLALYVIEVSGKVMSEQGGSDVDKNDRRKTEAEIWEIEMRGQHLVYSELALCI